MDMVGHNNPGKKFITLAVMLHPLFPNPSRNCILAQEATTIATIKMLFNQPSQLPLLMLRWTIRDPRLDARHNGLGQRIG